jgi:hypothetical protein
MKKAFAAFLIGIICISVLCAHAWWTWGDIDSLHEGTLGDREFFEYSLFLESFAFMLSAAYFVGPKIYRFFGEADAAVRFEGEKRSISTTVNIYSAVGVILRRLSLDSKMAVPLPQTAIAISLICIPALLALVSKMNGKPWKNA